MGWQDSGLRFVWSGWPWALLAVPVWWVLLSLAQRKRTRRWEALGQTSGLTGLRGWAWLSCLIGLILALGRPQWGLETGEELEKGHDVVLVMDTSRSMAAEDAFPSRLGSAQRAAAGLIDALGRNSGERAAVVAFAGRGVIACPLTENLGAVADVMGQLRPGEIRPGGSDLAAGLAAGIEALGLDLEERAGGRCLVVFSDGEDLSEAWPAWVPRLRDFGIVVHTVALGNADEGTPILWEDPGQGRLPIRYQGQVVKTRRRDEPLRRLALETGGVFVPLGTAETDLGALYEQEIRLQEERSRDEIAPARRAERFPVLILTSLALAIVAFLPAPQRIKTPRNGWVRGIGNGGSIVLILATAIGAGVSETPGELIRKGIRAYENGRFEEALERFEDARRARPKLAVAAFDAGEALFQLGRYAEAAERYRLAAVSAEPSLRARIEYAWGNAAVAMGEHTQAIEHYDACLRLATVQGGLERLAEDAGVNRAFALNLIEPERGGEREPQEGEGQAGGVESEAPRTERPEESEGRGEGQGGPPGTGSEPETLREAPRSGGGRTTGGMGGRSTGRRNRPGEPPEARLARAVEAIRRAREARLPNLLRGQGPAETTEERDW